MKTISERIAELSPEKRELFTLMLGKTEPDQSGRTVTAGRRGSGALPLSFAQQRLWFLDQLEPGTAFYNLPAAVRLRGVLDLSALARSFAELVRRHETLRTTFRVVDEQPEQVVSPTLAPGLPVFDLSHLDVAGREAQVARLAKEEAQSPFDLTAGPLLRLRVLRLAEEEHVLLLTMHHIISDGWSMGVLIKEVVTLYSAYAQGQPSPLPDLPVQYADYAIWQRDYLTGEQLDQQLDYWREQLKRVTALELPRDKPRRSERSYRGASVGFNLTKELTQSLQELSERAGATLFMTLLAAFQTLLHRYTNQQDICVGTPIANRNRAEIEGLIGFFVNTLVMRNDFSGDPTFGQLLGRVRETALGAYANQDVPFERLVEELQPERDLSHSPLFQVLFTMQNAPEVKAELPGLEVEMLERQIQIATFDLSLVLQDSDQGMSGLLTGSLDLFEPEKLDRFVEHYEVLLESIVAGPEQKISQLPILSDAERQKLLVEWNDTQSATPDEHLIHQAIEATADRTPKAVAVRHEGEELTYSELNRRANQLARRLRCSGIGPEERVVIFMERSPEMLIALLGVLKAGGAYVPLDINLPSERLAFILNDVSAKALLTQETFKANLPRQEAEVIRLDAEWETIALEDGANLPCEVSAENLAYIIYTSGSTGTPKGVMVQHGSIKNYVETAIAEFGLEASDRVLQFASLSFDTSAEEIYPTLSAGATLLLRNDEMLASASTFLETCRDWGVTVLDLPTAYWHELALNMSAEHRELLGQLRLVIVGGERALSQRLENWQRYASGLRLLNGYGPTETTVVVTFTEVTERPHSAQEIPIGRPIQNVQLYVLDRQMQLVPTGVPGELYVGGAALSRGYFEQPSLTAQAFIPHPFSKIGSERLYRTGDVVKYRADGELEYVGRADRQVKIRGFRIELGEIEAALCAQAGVHDAVVAAKERDDDDKQLVAYVVANANVDDDTRTAADATIEHDNSYAGKLVVSLKSALGQMLPAYMVPQAFIVLDELPLTSSGKVDYRRLPAPGQGRPTLFGEYVAPRSAVEQIMARIWAELLRVERVGVNDNFFDLGGHSLLATRLIARLRSVLSVELPLRAVFETPTLVDLSESVLQQDGQRARIEKTAEVLLDLERLSEGEAGQMLEEVTVSASEREAR